MRFLFLVYIWVSFYGYSQYCGTPTSDVGITPSASVQYTSYYNTGRRLFTFNAVAGNEYTFSTVGQTTSDTYLRLYSGTTLIAENDDYYDTQSEITWYCSTSGTYSILLTKWSCNALTNSVRLKYQCGNYAGSTIVTIGSGEGVVYTVPAYHYYKYNWSQMIYLKSEINTAGKIQKIRFHVTPTSPLSYVAENQKIYMGHTTLSSFPSVIVKENAQTNYVTSNYTLVFSGTITWTIGWVEITLDTPFDWNNTDNLIIKYENRENSYSSNYPGFYYTSNATKVGYNYSDASYPTSDGTRDGFRPNIKLIISEFGLPIELSEFGGFNAGDRNIIHWATESENNTSHFDIEKSVDGTYWKTITSVGAMGNSYVKVKYSIDDRELESEYNYYRLRQHDKDGYYELFSPILIMNQGLNKKTIVKYLTMNGQEIELGKLDSYGVYIEVYDDNTMRKVCK